MPKDLKPYVLYVSKEYNTAAHLCACGCGSKIRTPLGATEWTFVETEDGPTLSPSIGNWQQQCQSHYLITSGRIYWADKWSSEQIEEGRLSENKNRDRYYKALQSNKKGLIHKLWAWIKDFWG